MLSIILAGNVAVRTPLLLIARPKALMQTNVDGGRLLLQSSVENKIKRFIFTGLVYRLLDGRDTYTEEEASEKPDGASFARDAVR